MHIAGRLLRGLGLVLGVLALSLVAVFAVLQTQLGKAWLGREIGQALSDPDFTVAIDGLKGFVPFQMTVERIDIGDRDGTYLTLRDASLDISPSALLAGKAHIRLLTMAEIDMARLSTAPSTTPFIDYLKVPRLPIPVVLDRLSIGKLTLAPPVLGESVAATAEGSAELADGKAHIALDLHRIDDSAGNILLAMEIAGDSPVLSLKLDAADPTGLLLDRLLARTDHLPLTLSVNGTGPLADWHGRVNASAGVSAHFKADLTLAAADETILGISGTAGFAALLPTEIAPLIGDQVALSMRTKFGDGIVVDPLSVEIAAGVLTGHFTIGGPQEAVAADLRANLPELSMLSGLLGQPLGGSAVLTASVTGTKSRPSLELNLSSDGTRLASSGADHVEADIRASPIGAVDNPETRIELAATGRVQGLLAPEGVAMPPELGRDIAWSLAATAARNGRAVDLTRLSAEGAGISLAGSGRMTETGAIEGRAGLAIADLRPFSGLVGHPLAGSVEIEANAERKGTTGFTATVAGWAKELRTGVAAADALLGGEVTIAGAIERDADLLTLDRLAITGAAVSLSGNARFFPAPNGLTGALAAELPRLKPLGAAFGTDVTGAVSAQLNFAGPLEHLRIEGDIDGAELAAAGVKLDRLRLAARVEDLADPKASVDGTFRAYGLDGKLALAADLEGNSELVLPRFRLAAADSTIDGSLRVALDTGLMRGSVTGRSADLAPWSKLAGTPLGGSVEFGVGLDAPGGQLVDISAIGTKLAAGTGSARIAAGRLAVTARFADILRATSGSARLTLSTANFGASELATATLSLDAPRPGRFVFQGDAKGQPLTVALAGDGALEPGRADLRLNRLAGSLGGERLVIEQPLTLSKHGADLAFSGLALDFGAGRITGSGGVRADSLSLALNVANLPIASVGRLAGFRKARGTLNAAATLGGTLRAPQGRMSLNARELSVAPAKHSRLKGLGLVVDGSWNGRNLDVKGQVTGLEADQVALTGAVPLLLTPAPLGISVPPDGRLALQVQGAGQIEHLADLLPLGEDRVSGHFAVDAAVGGTVTSPAARGRLKLSDGHYENFATGAVLNNMQADLVGDRDRFTLTSFSAADTASGTLKAQGNVALSGPTGPNAQLSATLANFRVAARDEAVATASGTVAIAGPLTAPKITAPLTIDRADISLPDSLPPNVVVLKVVERNGTGGKAPPPAPADGQPALPATLDITLDMPGNIFVRGHGLESEWRGRLTITGTSAAPVIAGSLEQIRGSVDLLGKTFTLTRGTITFDGSAKLDPVLDIVAEASAADITAQVNISGPASAPKITLSSTPSVPQDEILARVLFNRGVGQISAGEGIQLAAAASALAGGGPGVLDRLRGGLGLDWFKLGSGPSGPASTTLNPRATANSATGGTALSAGKYLAPGVSVGVSQGLSPPTSKVTVEIELRPHLTVQGEAGQSGSTGIGLNYNYDY